MVTIPLTRGKVAVLDDEDAYLARFPWHAVKTRNGRFYAVRTRRQADGPGSKVITLHGAILGIRGVDHIDGDGLNCRRSNLRPATDGENLCNRGPASHNTSGFKGVTWNREKRRWQAQIGIHKRMVFLGLFRTREPAARAYDAAARKLHGRFAKLNFP